MTVPAANGRGRPIAIALILAALVAGLGYAAAASFGWLPEREEPPPPWTLTPDPRPPPELLGGDDGPPLRGLVLTPVAEGFEEPVAAVAEPGTGRMFVLERRGVVRLLTRSGVAPDPVLDLTDRVSIERSLERGLVGIALHPDYASNRRVFLSYTDTTTDLVVAEYRASDTGTSFGHEPVAELLRVEQPGLYHHGGTMLFGPDGYLWIGLGDGGGTGGPDPHGHAQDPATLKGTLTRIDVNRTVGDLPYGIPRDNPYLRDESAAPEVWAFGLRNPWSFAFDSDAIYIADVGDVTWEEINVLSRAASAGANFGWSIFEGPECMRGLLCDEIDAVEPIVTLPRERVCAVIGGPVYRGSAIPELHGHYFYGDYCFGWIRSILVSRGRVVEHLDWEPHLGARRQLNAFAVDEAGEVYAIFMSGDIFRIDPVR